MKSANDKIQFKSALKNNLHVGSRKEPVHLKLLPGFI